MTHHGLRRDYTRVMRGIWVPNESVIDAATLRRAALTRYPAAVLCGWTAAELHRMPYAEGRPIEILLPRRRRSSELIIHTEKTPPSDVTTIDGLRVTTGVRTAFDLARWERGDDAVAALDQALRVQHDRPAVTTREELEKYIDEGRYLRCGTHVEKALAVADGRAESPPETWLRLWLHRLGYEFMVPQVEVDGGRYRIDLGAEQFRGGSGVRRCVPRRSGTAGGRRGPDRNTSRRLRMEDRGREGRRLRCRRGRIPAPPRRCAPRAGVVSGRPDEAVHMLGEGRPTERCTCWEGSANR
ncbi:hypothetical protein GCM10023147_51130 [Tsukamurella soli]|uniref:AbiEi antitoxin C-terminal domain-containing protein n=1 Tax=Tsukamurella soli TaxID=644556 RepID=A0ABP8KI57_9ACTN